ncbi:MAG: Spy/CpxP family protein refolding chaperone [Shewanella sp.]
MKIKSILLLVATAYFSTAAMAKDTGEGSSEHQNRYHQQHHQSHGCDGVSAKGMHKMFKGLDLSDEQRQQFKQLMEKTHSDEGKESRQQARAENRQAMHALITAPQFDETAAKALLEKQSETRQARAIDNLRVRNQAYNLLTPEQQQQWQQRIDTCQKIR